MMNQRPPRQHKPQAIVQKKICRCGGIIDCVCPTQALVKSSFMANVDDIAESVADILVLTGVPKCKARAAVPVLRNTLLYYSERRHRIDALPRKRMAKEDLIHGLGLKCSMNRMEAQIGYTLMKRVFRAFYYGSLKEGFRDAKLDQQLKHTPDCLWLHAAQRSAQIIAGYKDMFLEERTDYQRLLWNVYKHLYVRIVKRSKQLAKVIEAGSHECTCGRCAELVQADRPHTSIMDVNIADMVDPLEENATNTSSYKMSGSEEEGASGGSMGSSGEGMEEGTSEHTASCEDVCNLRRQQLPLEKPRTCKCSKEPLPEESHVSLHQAYCKFCNCPRLICDCNIPYPFKIWRAECEGCPFDCYWEAVDSEEEAQARAKSAADWHRTIADYKDVCSICDLSEEESFYDINYIETCEMDEDGVRKSELSGVESRSSSEQHSHRSSNASSRIVRHFRTKSYTLGEKHSNESKIDFDAFTRLSNVTDIIKYQAIPRSLSANIVARAFSFQLKMARKGDNLESEAEPHPIVTDFLKEV